MTVTYPTRPSGIPNAPTSLPPPELRAAFPDLDAACSELERLKGERADVRKALELATNDRRAAEHADIAAAATSHRAGKGDPGSPKVEAVDAKIRDLTRRRDILTTAMDDAGRDLADVIAQHRSEWTAKTTATVGKRRAALRAAALTWGDLRAEVGALESLARWLDGFPARPSYTTGSRHMTGPGPEGSRVERGRSYDSVLEELLTDADGPMPAIAGSVVLPDAAA